MSEAGGKSTSASPDDPPHTTRDRSLFLIVVGGTFGLQALTMVTGIISARLLGVEGRGEVALVFALGLVGSQLTFGGSLPNAIAKNLAERRLAARDGLGRIARRRGGLLVVPCLLAAGVLLLLQRSEDGGQKYALAACVFVMTLQTITFRLLIGSLQGEVGHLGRMALVGMVPQLGFTIALATAWAAGWDWSAVDVLVSFFVASLVGLVAGWFALARPTRRREDELDERELWAVTRKTYVSSVRPLDSVGIDRIMVGGLLGSAPLGLYAAATAVSNLCGIVGNAVSVIVLPRVAMNHDDAAAQRQVIRRWLTLSAGLMVVVVAGLELVVAWAIPFAFGSAFAGAVDAARWLILADGLMGFRKVLIAVLQGQGRGGTASWIELALTPVMIAGIVVAGIAGSLPGIGVTMLVVGALACVAMGAVVRRPVPAAARHRG